MEMVLKVDWQEILYGTFCSSISRAKDYTESRSY